MALAGSHGRFGHHVPVARRCVVGPQPPAADVRLDGQPAPHSHFRCPQFCCASGRSVTDGEVRNDVATRPRDEAGVPESSRHRMRQRPNRLIGPWCAPEDLLAEPCAGRELTIEGVLASQAARVPSSVLTGRLEGPMLSGLPATGLVPQNTHGLGTRRQRSYVLRVLVTIIRIGDARPRPRTGRGCRFMESSTVGGSGPGRAVPGRAATTAAASGRLHPRCRPTGAASWMSSDKRRQLVWTWGTC